jgi:adenylosuccinate lyase
MDERYVDGRVEKIWSLKNKLELWQKTELAFIAAMVFYGLAKSIVFFKIEKIWKSMPINLKWFKERDKKIHHDLNAFLEERVRHLPRWLQKFVHKWITSFDTEEPAFARMLIDSIAVVSAEYEKLEVQLCKMAKKFMFAIMMARTHGQYAELQTQGKRYLTWITELKEAKRQLKESMQMLEYSKIKGAIGNYGEIDPQLEKKALEILGFKPFAGATQIMPRILYAPIAASLCGMVVVIDSIATDIRLGARSGIKIYDEPFKKFQKGSSAMPGKKNTIRTEQMEGMARMALGYLEAIMLNIRTWEERAIEQSCVERVVWPDLFHVTVHSLKVMTGVINKMKIYPDNMLKEIHESRGLYASAEAKEFLKTKGSKYGLSAEEGYRIIQLAAFIANEPDPERLGIRNTLPCSLAEADELFEKFKTLPSEKIVSIQELIPRANLYSLPDKLAASKTQVQKWNKVLKKIFARPKNIEEWNILFQPSHLLKNEAILYEKIIGA